MRSSKTCQLLVTLSKKELVLLKKEIKLKKNQANLLEKCLKFMNSHHDFNIKEFYFFYHKKEYIKKNDNIIRNELRLLNKFLEKFIVEIEFHKQLKKDLYFKSELYLKYLLNRNSLDLFEKELNKVFRKIDENEDYFNFYPFFELWIEAQNKKFAFDTHYFHTTKAFYVKSMSKWFKEVSFKTRNFELFINFIERSNMQIEDGVNSSKLLDEIPLTKSKDSPFISFMEKKITALKITGEEKLTVLIDALKVLDKLDMNYMNKPVESFSLTQNIAVEYMISGKNEKALKYFSEIENLKGKIDDVFFIKGLFNYMTSLIKLQKYDKAIKLFEKYRLVINNSLLSSSFNNIVAMCLIFIDEIQQAEDLITIVSSSVSTENSIYSRFNLTIIYFLKNEIEMALNELQNISQTINYYHYSNKVHTDFISNFKKYIKKSTEKLDLKENKNIFIDIKTKVENNISHNEERYRGDTLHNFWLLKELKKMIALK